MRISVVVTTRGRDGALGGTRKERTICERAWGVTVSVATVASWMTGVVVRCRKCMRQEGFTSLFFVLSKGILDGS